MKAAPLSGGDKEVLNVWFDAQSADDNAAFLSGGKKSTFGDACATLSSVADKTLSLKTAKAKGKLYLKTTRGTEEQREIVRAKTAENVKKTLEASSRQTAQKRKLREELIAAGREVPMTAFNKKQKAMLEDHKREGGTSFNFCLNEKRRTKHADDKKTFGMDEEGFSNVPSAEKRRTKHADDKKTFGVNIDGESNVPSAEKKRLKLADDKKKFGVDIHGESNVPSAQKARKKAEADRKAFGMDKDGFSKVPRVAKARKKREDDKKAGKRTSRQLAVEAERAVVCDMIIENFIENYGEFPLPLSAEV